MSLTPPAGAAHEPPGQWWYYGLEHGQDVAFLSSNSLQVIVRRLDLELRYSVTYCTFWVMQTLIRITLDPRL